MSMLGAGGVLLWGAYVLLVAVLTTRARWVGYHAVVSPIVARFTTHTQGVTYWNWTFLLKEGDELTEEGRKHEDAHVAQYARWPLSFPVRYIWEWARRGGRCSRYEEEAREISGEGRRCL